MITITVTVRTCVPTSWRSKKKKKKIVIPEGIIVSALTAAAVKFCVCLRSVAGIVCVFSSISVDLD
jgi:hypothetical protein